MRAKLCVLGGLSAALLGCNHTSSPPKTIESTKVVASDAKILSASETHPYIALTLADRFLYAGTADGLLRFTLGSSEHVRLTKDQGLSGNAVSALAYHPSTGLWIATDGGVSRLHDGAWTNMPKGQAPVTAMAATSSGLWAGSGRGLGLLTGDKWKFFLPGVRVTSILRDLSGDGVWVATNGEGLYHYESGKFVSHAAPQGQPLRTVRAMAFARDGGLFAVGSSAKGDRLVYFDGRHWASYTLDVAGKLHWVNRVNNEVLVAAGERILIIRRADLSLSGPKEPPVGPVKLTAKRSMVAPPDYPLPYFYTSPLDMWLPPDPTVVVGQGDRVLIGTQLLGAVVFDGKKADWYRTNMLTAGHERLKVACASEDCFFAGGGRRAYRLRKGRFESISVDPDSTAEIQAFVHDNTGAVLALFTTQQKPVLLGSRWNGTAFERVREHPLVLPTPAMHVRFARTAPDGRIWVGLAYRDGDGELRPWGVAVLLRDGKNVLAHRSALLPQEDRQPGSLALPDDVRDVYFRGETTWLATDSGVCKVDGKTVQLFTENEGLDSEISYSVTSRASGELIVATYGGVGRYDGKQWLFDMGEELAAGSRAVLAAGGVLWAGTSKGLYRIAGKTRTRLTTADGLADDGIKDLYLDRGGRLWVLTDRGLSVISR